MIKITRISDLKDRFENFYPLSKRINELTGSVFLNYGLEIVSLRYFNTYGIGENTKGNYASVIWKFIDDIRNDRVPIVYGDGSQKRDFVFVDDVLNALELAMKSEKNGIYNVGTGKSYSLNDMMKMLTKITNKDIKAKYIENSIKNYVVVMQASTDKAKRELGFEAKVLQEQGIKK
ncbi:MAG: NAD-dependent epimerase/dehydratase family protein [Thermoplasmata archaeon]